MENFVFHKLKFQNCKWFGNFKWGFSIRQDESTAWVLIQKLVDCLDCWCMLPSAKNFCCHPFPIRNIFTCSKFQWLGRTVNMPVMSYFVWWSYWVLLRFSCCTDVEIQRKNLMRLIQSHTIGAQYWPPSVLALKWAGGKL